MCASLVSTPRPRRSTNLAKPARRVMHSGRPRVRPAVGACRGALAWPGRLSCAMSASRGSLVRLLHSTLRASCAPQASARKVVEGRAAPAVPRATVRCLGTAPLATNVTKGGTWHTQPQRSRASSVRPVTRRPLLARPHVLHVCLVLHNPPTLRRTARRAGPVSLARCQRLLDRA